MSASFAISKMNASKLLKPSATIYVIGNIKQGLLQGVKAAYCKWQIICDEKNWIINNGEQSGQSWIAENSTTNNKCLWIHPFDIEFRCKALSGAPKLYLEIYSANKTIDFC